MSGARVHDLDTCLLETGPSASDDDLFAKVRVDKWERSNRISLMIIKRNIFKSILDGFSATKSAKEFLEAIRQKFKESNKAETYNLLGSFPMEV